MDGNPNIYQFDDVRVDLEKFDIIKADSRVHLEPKAFEVLVFLIKNRGRLVEKKELLDAVWKDAFVTENAMTRVIAQLRKALGDDSREAKYIETVPTRGYRFIAEVKEQQRLGSNSVESRTLGQAESTAQAESETDAVEGGHTGVGVTVPRRWNAKSVIGKMRGHKLGLGIILFTLLLPLAAVAYLVVFGRGGKEALSSIAVLPFVNGSNDPNSEYLSDGISESLINQLSQLPQLKVIARSSSFKYKGKETDPQELAKALGVRVLVTGRVVQRGDHLIISAELVDTRDGTQMWGQQYERPVADLVAIQHEIAKAITVVLRLKLPGEAQSQMNTRPAGNVDAYELYLKGRYSVNTLMVDAEKNGLGYFRLAIERDPGYAPAYAGLAETFAMLSADGALPPNEAIPNARAAALKALEIDEMLAEAHTSLGYIEMNYDWDWSSAEREFKRAIVLNPSYANAHHWYSHYLVAMGRFEESLAESKRALELDPLDVPMNFHLGWHYFLAGQYDQAVAQLGKTIEMNKNSVQAHDILGSAYEQLGRYDEAIAEFQKAMDLQGTAHQPRIIHAYAASGRKDEARKMLNKVMTDSKQLNGWAYTLAMIYEALGERDNAFVWLEKGYKNRDSFMTELGVQPNFKGLRSDPRFADLLRRMGLPQ